VSERSKISQEAGESLADLVVEFVEKYNELKAAMQPFVDACKRYEANHGDFAKAFHEVTIADIRRAAAIKL
jgi:hypothetical protein